MQQNDQSKLGIDIHRVLPPFWILAAVLDISFIIKVQHDVYWHDLFNSLLS